MWQLSFSLKGTSRLAFRYKGLSSLLNPGGSQQAQFEAHIKIDNPNHFPMYVWRIMGIGMEGRGKE